MANNIQSIILFCGLFCPQKRVNNKKKTNQKTISFFQNKTICLFFSHKKKKTDKKIA